MRRLAVLIILSLLFSSGQVCAKDGQRHSYRLGIFPYMAPRQTVEFYGPVAASMEKVLNHPVRLESVQTFTAFSNALDKKRYDIALIQPFDYPKVVGVDGYIPLAQFAVPLVTQFVVRDDSRFHRLEDLRGTVVAMPPEPAANSRMGLRALNEHNLIPGKNIQLRYFSSHDSCIQQVWAGVASACTTAKPPVLIFEKRMQAKLRTIYKTNPIPHVLFVASPDLPKEQRAKLQALIIGWSSTEKGRAILKNLGFPGFIKPKPAEYAVMRHYAPVGKDDTVIPTDKKGMILGVFPFLAARQLAQNFAPVLPALSQAIGTKIHLRTAINFDSFSHSLGSADYDVVVVQPFDYDIATKHGYLPLAAMKEPAQGTFFVLKDSPYRQVKDFRGHHVAMPPYESAQAFLGRQALIHAGLQLGRDVKIDYRTTHDSCLRQVNQGVAAACITSKMVLPMIPANISQNLRSVGITETVPGVVFMAHERLSKRVREQLRTEILSWSHNVRGHKILKSIGLGEFVPVNVKLYQRLSGVE